MIGVIAQARITSKRFPAKVVHPLLGKPVLEHVLERAKAIEGVDIVICAFPDDPVSKPIEDICRRMDVATFAGPEHDVLKRYWQAANLYELDVIIRLTCDCPLLEPAACEDVLDMFEQFELDYACNCWPERTFPKGWDCEVFSWDALDAAHQKATSKYDREHVTPWLQKRNGINRALLKNSTRDLSSINLCVDFPEDIERIEKIIKNQEIANYAGRENVTLH